METLSLPSLAQQLVPLPDWEHHFDTLTARHASRFARTEVRQQASDYLKGWLSPIEGKNGWQLAEHLGHQTPDRVQHFLDRAAWDEAAVREDLPHYVVENLADQDAVRVVDETGFLKKGRHSVGGKRQDWGTAGRIENSPIGVFVGYATSQGQT